MPYKSDEYNDESDDNNDYQLLVTTYQVPYILTTHMLQDRWNHPNFIGNKTETQ